MRAWRRGGVALLIIAVACGGDAEVQVEPARPKKARSNQPVVPPREPAAQRTISWTGCDISRKAYMVEAAAAYQASTGVTIVVTGGGATRGIRATAGGQFDIGGTCRHFLPDVASQEKGALLTHVAWDALVFFTHNDNPVDSITTEQAKLILRGKIDNWGKVGGPDEKIFTAFRRQTKQGKLSGVGFMTRLLLFGNADQDYTTEALFYRSSRPIEQFVESTPFSFAVTGVSSAKKRDVKILALDGVDPTDKRKLMAGDYKLFRPLYLVTRGPPQGEVLKFLDWITGPEGQKVLSDEGTVNLTEGAELKKKYRHWPADKGLIRNYQ